VKNIVKNLLTKSDNYCIIFISYSEKFAGVKKVSIQTALTFAVL
jgi:hypothetical protein